MIQTWLYRLPLAHIRMMRGEENLGIDASVCQLCVDLLDLQRLMELIVG